MSRELEVRLHGQVVGRLVEDSTGQVEFRLTEAYRTLVSRPVLGQKFEDDLEKTYGGRKRQPLPDFFANLIPEGPLRSLIEEDAGIVPGDDLALLAYVGRDLPGAVEVIMPGNGDAVGEPPERESREGENGGEQDTGGLRFSLAGVQLKFSVLRRGDKITLPATNEKGEWIVKFDSPVYSGLPENEVSMLEWARASGFDVPECSLLGTEALSEELRRSVPAGGRVLAIKRYDRDVPGPIHQEDFAQAVGLPPIRKYDHISYEQMARLIRSFAGEEAVGELVRRLTFVIASGNNDAHLKNWSLIYPDRIRAAWSPLYDQVATVAWPEPDRKLALNMAAVKDFHRLGDSVLERFSEAADVSPVDTLRLVRETLELLRDVWADECSNLPILKEHRRALAEHWQRVPLLREAGGLPQ